MMDTASNHTRESPLSSLSPVGAVGSIVATVRSQPLVALTSIAITLALVAVTTRIVTSNGPAELKSHQLGGGGGGGGGGGAVKIPRAEAYWLPWAGHLLRLFYWFDGFLATLHRRYVEGVVSLRLFGRTHHIISSPAFMAQLLGAPLHVAEMDFFFWKLVKSLFDYRESRDIYDRVFYTPGDPPYRQLSSDPGLGEITDETVRQLKKSIADLVTFNTSGLDQMAWEREGEAEVVRTPTGEQVVEADLMLLTRTFVSATASPALWGSNFVENFPDIWEPFWEFDNAFTALAANVPFWVPWPAVQKGRAARRKLLAAMCEFHEALEKWSAGTEDPGVEWQDLDDMSRLVKWRLAKYRAEGMPLRGRAATDLALLWAANANANPAVSWMLAECYRDPVLLEQVREEIAPFVEIEQPEGDLGGGIWVAPVVRKFDVDALLNRCPLLKSLYVEVMRVYVHSWSPRWMGEDLVLKEKDKDKANGGSYVIGKGSYAHAVQELHQFNEEQFEDPHEFKADRHITETTDERGVKTRTAGLGTIQPYGKSRAS